MRMKTDDDQFIKQNNKYLNCEGRMNGQKIKKYKMNHEYNEQSGLELGFLNDQINGLRKKEVYLME